MSAKDREYLKSLLEERNWDGLLNWYLKGRGAVRILTALMYDDAPLIRWRAIEAFGRVAAVLAENDRESVRQIIRRFFWGMNDESGNLIRNAPEAIGEILFKTPELIPEYGFVLASFLKEEPFESGVHRALARLAPEKPDFLPEIAQYLVASLDDNNPAIRGNAAFILALIKPELLDAQREKLEADNADFECYDFEQGQIFKTTVADRLKNADTTGV